MTCIKLKYKTISRLRLTFSWLWRNKTFSVLYIKAFTYKARYYIWQIFINNINTNLTMKNWISAKLSFSKYKILHYLRECYAVQMSCGVMRHFDQTTCIDHVFKIKLSYSLLQFIIRIACITRYRNYSYTFLTTI